MSATNPEIAAIAAARTVAEAIELMRVTAKSLIGCDGIAVIRKDGEFCHYVEEDAIGALWKGQKFPMIACISGWSMLNRQTVVVPDIHTDPRIPLELYLGTFVRALAMTPINSESPVGALGAYWAKPQTPRPAQVTILETIASAATPAMATR